MDDNLFEGGRAFLKIKKLFFTFQNSIIYQFHLHICISTHPHIR